MFFCICIVATQVLQCRKKLLRGWRPLFKKVTPTMMLLFLTLLCRYYMTSIAADASRSIEEQSMSLLQCLRSFKSEQDSDIETDNLDRMLSVVEAIEPSVSRSQMFWENTDWYVVSGDEVRSELDRLEIICTFFSIFSELMTSLKVIKDNDMDIYKIAWGNVTDCREWLRQHEGLCDKAECRVHVDFPILLIAIEYCMDRIKSTYLFFQIMLYISPLTNSSSRIEKPKLLEISRRFDDKYKVFLKHFEDSTLRKYMPQSEKECKRLFSAFSLILEQCETMKNELDRLFDAEGICMDRVQCLYREMKTMCSQAEYLLDRISEEFSNYYIPEGMYLIVRYVKYMIRLKILQNAEYTHRQALMGDNEASCCLL